MSNHSMAGVPAFMHGRASKKVRRREDEPLMMEGTM